ncbi:pyridoxamine 5'-phosphate oxidase family protein [Streptomyces gobiensis]|uniref:pyridoxamine 5'-phosphate oxidase family protein n=1 Tax=Streptomyces gobiensis TaxID=2875706 RepID=UPI001E2B70B9|nr:pyridoxamine 5'-phosphate oxidase family protein [Streptomyces gobiensis]UGY91998.1 pyridoxamine 5'-phosphate oxidase family protein [Streptomyces gobiensis]
MALSREERERFLAEPHIGALGVDGGPGRGPLLVPVWYGYEPGGDIWIVTGADSRKAGLIRAAGRFSLLAETTEPTVRYVSAEGPVTETSAATEDQYREITARYLSGAAFDRHMAIAESVFGAQIVIRMRPERWLSADLGPT